MTGRRRRWSPADRQRFADRDILRASSRPGRRRPPPELEEWDEVRDDELEERLP